MALRIVFAQNIFAQSASHSTLKFAFNLKPKTTLKINLANTPLNRALEIVKNAKCNNLTQIAHSTLFSFEKV